jgi:hypothetical protein
MVTLGSLVSFGLSLSFGPPLSTPLVAGRSIGESRAGRSMPAPWTSSIPDPVTSWAPSAPGLPSVFLILV